jgi:hypothetical protein
MGIASPSRLAADVLFSIPWGSGEREMGFYNHRKPGFDQPFAEGPGAIAVSPGGEVWISDQWNDRILRFGRDGRALATVRASGARRLNRPKALWVGGEGRFAVVDGTDASVLVHEPGRDPGHAILGARGESRLVQVETLLCTPRGDLWAGDFGLSSLVCLDPPAESGRRVPWELSGAAFDSRGRLHVLRYTEDGRPPGGDHHLVVIDDDGSRAQRWSLRAADLEDLVEPLLVGIDPTGRVIVRFARPGAGGVSGARRHVLVRYDPDGRASRILCEVPAAPLFQQFALAPDGAVLGLAFDPEAAPAGEVCVVEHR